MKTAIFSMMECTGLKFHGGTADGSAVGYMAVGICGGEEGKLSLIIRDADGASMLIFLEPEATNWLAHQMADAVQGSWKPVKAEGILQ